MSDDPSSAADDARHHALAKSLLDLDSLVRLFVTRLQRAKPWQRHLVSQMTEVDRLIEVFRLTVAMERGDDEILAASEHLAQACRKASTAIAGVRCDMETKAAIQLIVDLSARIHKALRAVY